jgi:hypothetical protein
MTARAHVAVGGDHEPLAAGSLHALRSGQAELGALIGGLLLHRGAEQVAGHAFRKSGEVLDLLGVREVPTRDVGHQHERGAAVAGGEYRRRQRRHAAAQEGDVIVRQGASAGRHEPQHTSGSQGSHPASNHPDLTVGSRLTHPWVAVWK